MFHVSLLTNIVLKIALSGDVGTRFKTPIQAFAALTPAFPWFGLAEEFTINNAMVILIFALRL